MATFLSDLWTSILTPGTNSALITATHVSFAALQTTLFGLLVATRSWHFVFLSLLSAGLWTGITWFIGAVEEEARRIEKEAEKVRNMKKAEEQAGEEEETTGEELGKKDD